MKKLLIPFLSLLLYWTTPVRAEDIQTTLALVAEEQGMIFVRNDTILEPVEVYRSQTGKLLVCLTNDMKKFRLYKIANETFTGGQESALIRCWNGNIHVGKGYL